jgi:hypothetical protein
VAIQLGKDCVISVDGVTLVGVRAVNVQRTARTIDVDEYGSRQATVYPTGFETSVSIEFNDIDGCNLAKDGIIEGRRFSLISVGGSGVTIPCVVTSFSESQPVDGVVTYTVEARLCRTGIQPNER